MRYPSTRGRRTFTTLMASCVAVSAVTFTHVTAANAAPIEEPVVPKDTTTASLGGHDENLLAQAEARGDRQVTLIIAADAGEASDVAAEVKKLGGTVTRRFDQVGYVLAQVPTGQVRKTAKLPGIAAVDLDEKIMLPDPEVQDSPAGTVAQAAPAAPGADTPAVNPYLPTNEIGGVDFKAANPTWDGRGVTIGIMDSGVDLDHPALQKTTTGQRKIVDWVTATDPLLEGDGSWRPMRTAVSGPSFSFGGDTWRSPTGSFLVNRLTEAISTASDAAGDFNRDGDTTDTFGILYDPATHDIRVDSDQDRDFTDNPVMRPYNEKFDIGHFGTDNPATAVSERLPFVVEFREDVDLTPAGLPGQVADFVSIGVVESAHGTHVAGITAANDLFGNAAFDGQAPGATLVSARACSWGGGCTAAALTTGMADLVINRKVDVVNMSIGGLPPLNDANNARARLYDKLINDYGVQMFISAGNSGPGVNTVGDPSVASNVVSVAASISKDTWLANYGSVVRKQNALFNFSSRGPREDGGFKPNLAAPGSAVSTIPAWQPGEGPAETGYTLPAGYGMFNGTSMAAPQATGGAALLLSAARATDRAVTPAGLRRALYSSAVPIADVGVYAQGNGMMDLDAAWALLSGRVETRGYTSSAPVCTAISDSLAEPGRGTGIYNRCVVGAGGHLAGTARTYDVQLTRTTGPVRGIVHQLTVVGDTRAFRAQANVVLPLNRTVTVPITVRPAPGVNSAILRVDDPATSTVDFEVLNTVVAAARPAAPEYTVSRQSTVDRNSSESYFVTVPEGAKALQVNLSGIAAGSQTRFIAINPSGVPVESTASTACYTNFSDAAACKPQERAYENPAPGVWEIEVESRRTSPSLENPFQLTARIQGVTVSPETVTLPSVTAGQANPASWTVQNAFGPLTVSGQGGTLGSAVSKRPSIATGETQTFPVVVTAGATRLDVRIGGVSDLGADLDLAVYLDGRLVGQEADGDSEEAVSIPNPAAGTYTVEVVGYAVPSGTTAFDYRDVYYSPALGSVSVPNQPTALASGAQTVIDGSVTAATAPPAGRTLFGEMTVVTDEGAVVGRGAVSIGAVQ